MPISYRQEVYRKLVHLSSLWMPVAMYLLPRWPAALLFAILLVLNLLVEYGYYRHWPFFYRSYDWIFGRMMRDKAPGAGFRMSGGPPVLASACLCVALFHQPYAICAFTIMLLGDTAAALIGRRWGRIRFSNGKSLEGTLAFILTGWLVIAILGICFHFDSIAYGAGAVAVILAALAEFYNEKLRLDDNFSIPLIIGLILGL